MTKARLDGLYILMLGSIVFILMGVTLEHISPVGMADFRTLYYSARCLSQHCDPYNESEVFRVAQADGGDRPRDHGEGGHVFLYVYFPTAFSLTLPVAMLPWGLAHILWMMLTIGSMVLASFLIWDFGAGNAPVLSGALAGFLLANSELLLVYGNIAGIAISLCVVAVWCFLRERFVLAGILCLAVSLAVKPHDAGLVWLYFLLAGGVFRKRALQTLLATVAVSLPGIFWVWHVAPNWIEEMRSNVLAFSVHGGLMDPDFTSSGTVGIGMLINLQTVTSAFWSDPHIYNLASYLICVPLLLVWGFVTLRYRASPSKAWLAIAAIAALSLLPIYHRQHDAKLLLLTVPACAMLWAERGLIGWIALLANTAGFVLTGDIPWAIFFSFASNLPRSTAGFSRQILMAMQVFPTPLILLAMGIFYLWVFARRCSVRNDSVPFKDAARTPAA